MSTLRVNTLQDATGSNQPAMVGAAKAWVNFNGTGTVAIRAAFNVSSVTDHGTGDYTVSFATAMTDNNYSVTATAGRGGNGTDPRTIANGTQNPNAGSVRMIVQYPTDVSAQDVEYISVAIFR